MPTETEIKEKFHFYKIKKDSLPAKIQGYSSVTCAMYKERGYCPEDYEVTECIPFFYTHSIVTCELKGGEEEEEEPTTADITFSSTPPNAAVIVDGVRIGNT